MPAGVAAAAGQAGSYQLAAEEAGEYAICFANEYSSDQKAIYLDVSPAGSEETDPIEGVVAPGDGALTLLESELACVRPGHTWPAVGGGAPHRGWPSQGHPHAAEDDDQLPGPPAGN